MIPPRQSRVLVVEDDLQVREFYRVVLSLEGYAVTSVEDGVDALRYIDSGELPDLIILDLQLPRLTGRDVKRELRAHAATLSIPILIITGLDPQTLSPDDFRCVIRKPVSAEGLVGAVAHCLRVGSFVES